MRAQRIEISQATAILRWLLFLPVTFSAAALGETLAAFLRVIPGAAGHVAFGFAAGFAHTFLAVSAARIIAPQFKRAAGALVWCGALVELIGRFEYLLEVPKRGASGFHIMPQAIAYGIVFMAGPTIAALLPTYAEVRIRWKPWNTVVRNLLALPLAIAATAAVHYAIEYVAPTLALRDTAIEDLESRYLSASVFLIVVTAMASSRKRWVSSAFGAPFFGRGIWMLATGLGDVSGAPNAFSRVEGAIEILATIVPLVTAFRYRKKPLSMNATLFWEIIARCAASKRFEKRTEILRAQLETLEPPAIREFADRFREFEAAANTWDLWGAAYVLNGGASSDGFDYFRRWLISEGRDVFERALANPESLAAVVDPALCGTFELEEFAYVAPDVYASKTDSEFSYATQIPDAPRGEPFAEDDERLAMRYPRLSRLVARSSG